MSRYLLSAYYDTDLWPLRDDPAELRAALDAFCTCGHQRREHNAADGAHGSFGGSACGQCWTCATFTTCDFCKGRPVGNAARWTSLNAPTYAACPRCGKTNDPTEESEKGEPMTASTKGEDTTTTDTQDVGADDVASAAETVKEKEKEKRDPTRYHVLKLSQDAATQDVVAWVQITKTAIAASSTKQAIELTLDGGEGNGTYVAVPERSFMPKKVKVEEVKTTNVIVAD